MHLPQFRLRTLMIAVAVVGSVIGSAIELSRRSERFRTIAAYHAALAEGEVERVSCPEYPGYCYRATSLGRWRWGIVRKYEHGARYPWLPLALDPPKPD